ncbi:MAG: hypothetical protein MUO96_05195 [Actinobacteria bacterium]|nr:hypothetical protein [Actinomycetota bacterium]
MILVSVLGLSPSRRTLGTDHHIGARCMAARTASTSINSAVATDIIPETMVEI